MPVEFHKEAQGAAHMMKEYKERLAERRLVFGDLALTNSEMAFAHKYCNWEMVDPRVVARAEAKRYAVWSEQHPFQGLLYFVADTIRVFVMRHPLGVAIGIACLIVGFHPYFTERLR